MKKKSIDHLHWEDGDLGNSAVTGVHSSPPALVPVQEIVLEQSQGATAAECVKHDLYMSRKHAAYSAAYLARAGWQLAQEKFRIGHGGWEKWCQEDAGISSKTADRYIKFFNATVGEWRKAQGLANSMVAELTDKMIAAATAELEYKTGTQAMIELGIIKRPDGWGGDGRGQGRKSAAVAAEDALSDSDAATVMWRDAVVVFEQNRAAFRSAARDLRPDVARHFLAELEMLVDALKERVGGKRGGR